MKKENRNLVNLVVDIVLLLLFAAISSLGFIMKYIMPSGYAIRQGGAKSYASDIFGMGRHEWGEIHWVLSVTFIILLIIHIILHWKMIVGIFKRMIPDNTTRLIIWLVIAIITFILLAGPFLFML